MKRIFTFLLLGLLLVFGIGAYQFYGTITPPSVSKSVPFAQLSPQDQTQRRQDATKLTEQIQSVARDAKKGSKKKFTVTATEDQLNTLLQDRLDTSKFPVRDLRVGLAPQSLSLQGRMNYQGYDATGTIAGNITAQNGILNYQAESLKVQGFSIGAMRAKAETEINNALQKWSGELPGRIDKVTIEDRKLTIEGTTQK